MSLILIKDRYLHPLVYFIADKPTKENLSPKIPLVGTKSYRTLLGWCGEMNVDVSRVRMFNQSDKPFNGIGNVSSLNQATELGHIRVVALGNKAFNYLLKVGVNEFFVLPHPSGRNRQLNNKKFVQEKLDQCRDYIYGEQNE